MNDLKFAFRQLLKNPGFTTVAVLALALGIGANTAIFSLVNAVLLRPLPYRDPGQLVQVRKENPPGGDMVLGGGELIGDPEFLAWRRESRSFSHLTAFSDGDVNLTGTEEAERITCAQVTRDFFPLLGVQPLLGRNFLEDEDRPGGVPVVMVSHGLWQRRFGGDRSLLGRAITLDGRSHTVVGILPPTFQFPQPFELWCPLALNESTVEPADGAGMRISLLRALGRLKPGVTVESARAELEVIKSRMQRPSANRPMRIPASPITGAPEVATAVPLGGDTPPPGAEIVAVPFPGPSPVDGGPPGVRFPAAPTPPAGLGATDVVVNPEVGGSEQPMPFLGTGGRVKLVSLHEQVSGNVRPALLVLLGAVAFVLLIACANVGNLLLARAASRQREMAIRTALGAGRWRLIRQLLIESLLLALLGGAVGLLVATWGIHVLRGQGLATMPHLHQVGLDGWVLGFTFVISIITGLAFGLAPALHAAGWGVSEALKEGGRNIEGGRVRNRLRNLLVVSEVALALVLLVGAGLLFQSFVRLRSVPPGYRAEGVVTTTIRLTETRYPDEPSQRTYFRELLERIRNLPGVQQAGATDHLPLTHYSLMMTARIEGRPAPVFGKEPPVSGASVTPEYFAAMGIPLKAGRGFESHDRAGSAPVALVNEAFVRRFLRDENPIGKRVASSRQSEEWTTIVGVVGDVRQSGLEEEIVPEVYWPFEQAPRGLVSIAVRATGDPEALMAGIRSQARQLDKDQPLQALMSMEQRLAGSMASRRANMILLGSFALLALALAAVGIFGVMSYSVAQRVHEIGVRMALGARGEDVVGLVVRQGMGLVLAGVAVGTVAALALTRFLATLLFQVGIFDPITFGAVSLVLLLVALAASYLPARRAARVDPMVALRAE